MEPDALMLNLGPQAAAALIALSATRRGQPATAKVQATSGPGIEPSSSGQLWGDMKQRWLPSRSREA